MNTSAISQCMQLLSTTQLGTQHTAGHSLYDRELQLPESIKKKTHQQYMPVPWPQIAQSSQGAEGVSNLAEATATNENCSSQEIIPCLYLV